MQTFNSEMASVPTMEIMMPGRFKVRFREQNGDDEDIISKMKDTKDGTSQNNFIARLILSSTHPTNPNPTGEQIKKWKLRDKYYFLAKSRQLSLGDEVEWEHEFADGVKQNLIEKISNYDIDLEKVNFDVKKKGQPGYNSKLPQPYPEGQDGVDWTLTTGKKVGYDFMTVEMEMLSGKKAEGEQSINDKMRARNFRHNGQVIENFSAFSAREMREIRTHIETWDPDYLLPTECVNPNNPNMREVVSIFMIPTFFFPLG